MSTVICTQCGEEEYFASAEPGKPYICKKCYGEYKKSNKVGDEQ